MNSDPNVGQDRDPSDSSKSGGQTASRGGTHEQHVEAGRQSHKNTNKASDDSQKPGTSTSGSQKSGSAGSGGGSRGGTHEQHVEAGRQSHKNDNR